VYIYLAFEEHKIYFTFYILRDILQWL